MERGLNHGSSILHPNEFHYVIGYCGFGNELG
jgi:hypothetical protein